MLTDGNRLQQVPGVLWRRVLDGVLLLAPGEEAPRHVSPPGEIVWRLLAEPSTTAELAEELADFYGADERVVHADLVEMLETLRGIGAIRTAHRPNL